MSRHVIISDSTQAADIPDRVRVIERPEAPPLSLTAAGEIPLAVWRDTLSLMRDLRTLQALHNKTFDGVIRRSMEDLETLLDARIGSLAALLAEVDARAKSHAVEGGGL